MRRLSSKTSRILSYAGAGVVLATFVVKDVMAERLKNKTDSLSSAETFYLSQTYDVFIEDDLNYLKQEIDLTKAHLESTGNEDVNTDSTVSIRTQSSIDHLMSVLQYATNLTELVGKLPAESGRAVDVSKLYNDCQDAVAGAQRFQAGLPALVGRAAWEKERCQCS
jgi:hypothetical protein